MAEFNRNIWAPWRMEYIRSLDQDVEEHGCFLCHYWETPHLDREHHVLWRSGSAFVMMNRFPYSNGHLLVAHGPHRGELGDISDDDMALLARLIRESTALLRRVVRAQGFNVGFNVGQCAGAGLPDHLHAHIVPRWGGDTNFMAVLGDCRVVPDSLDALYTELTAARGAT
ncbi:MAG: HIT domain-containing protein [Phycisphaerae bacterium]|nr:HIT domain-containing protein [Phycisphaerae bacterium]